MLAPDQAGREFTCFVIYDENSDIYVREDKNSGQRLWNVSPVFTYMFRQVKTTGFSRNKGVTQNKRGTLTNANGFSTRWFLNLGDRQEGAGRKIGEGKKIKYNFMSAVTVRFSSFQRYLNVLCRRAVTSARQHHTLCISG